MKHKNLILSICLVAMIFSVIYLISCQTVAQEATQTPATTPATWTTGENVVDYSLIVDGLVRTPLELTYQSILQYPAVSETLFLSCPGVLEETRQWTGVPLKVLLAEVSPEPGATRIIFYATDGYCQALSLEEAQRDGVFLAYQVDGKTLSFDDGYPLRLVVKGADGPLWVRWIVRIEVV